MSELVVGSLKGLSSKGFVIDVASGSKLVQSGGILQVVQTVKTDNFSFSTTSYADITGLSATITPISASSKILITFALTVGGDTWNNGGSAFQLVRNSTNIGVTTAVSTVTSTTNSSFFGPSQNDTKNMVETSNMMFLDSPATTSAITYKIQTRINTGTGTNHVNRNSNGSYGGISTITLMEVAG